MSSELTSLDREARARALDVSRSFVVQAPAGSGKTTLLTQRLLALLARVDVPEEVLAITFTRKAAGEMRARVVEALRGAESKEGPVDAHQRLTWELARAALDRSDAKGWSLPAQPARLQIRTIDAFAQSLATRMPILSRAGASLDVEPEPRGLYDDATLRLLAEIEEGGAIERHLSTILEHFDNDYDAVRDLFADMLARRDHWLPSILLTGTAATWRERLEADLARTVEESVQALAKLLPVDVNLELWRSAIGAAARWPDADADMARLATLTGPAPPTPDALEAWQSVGQFLLTSAGKEWRKRLDKRCGFPPTHAAEKAKHLAALMSVAEIPGTLDAWREVALLPPPRYSDAQWRVVAALLELLKRLTAHLRVIFTERSRVDYTEVALAAREALGRPEEPTDLALRLDYRIRHILIDEFQDTSLGQIEFLRRLTAGWTGADGRSLFCVGDPMQSIYRFRQADVALFLRVRRHGIDNLLPSTLTLAQNFRSQAGIVDWVNATFSEVLPPADDFSRGAVRYTPAQATRESTAAPAVHVWPALALDLKGEARRVIEIVRHAQRASPGASIAVLARTRSHLRDIAEALRRARLPFQAIDFEVLSERRAVRDLCSITRAVCHRDDRVAWLAVLRAPFCGLRLGDLEVLDRQSARRTLWEGLMDPGTLAILSNDAQSILRRVTPVLDGALKQFGRQPLAVVVEGTWLALGGPQTVEEPADLENARVFFARLTDEESAGDLEDPVTLSAALDELHAAPDAAAGDRLQLSTIHRAKGLEWDVVIVPGLGRRPRGDRKRLLYTLELEHPSGASSLILAPARASAEFADPLEDYVRRVERERAVLENARLMYVAATRAKSELHLLGHVAAGDSDADDDLKPAANTLLDVLWPAVASSFEEVPRTRSPPTDDLSETHGGPFLQRLNSAWQLPPIASRALATERDLGEQDRRPDFDWVGEIARLVGVVVHRDLERRVRLRMAAGEAPAIDEHLFAAELRELGVPADRLTGAVERVSQAIRGILADDRGRWILAAHADEQSEWALTAEFDGELRRLVVDRSFVDEYGVRWIIDYKTSTHEGSALEAFLAQEAERYTPQLTRYAAVVARLGPQPVRAGLYFPLLGAWRELALSD